MSVYVKRKRIAGCQRRRASLAVWLVLAILTVAVGFPVATVAESRVSPAVFCDGWSIPAAKDVTLPTVAGTSAQSALLMEAATGDVIFAQNENARLPMASTTKIMTALVALEHCDPEERVTVTAEAVGVEGSSIYLTEGEVLSLEDLLYALLLESANDAAVAIAIHTAESVAAFADLMNRKAETLGLTDTHFVNPHGLGDEEHYTTAYELAIIMRAAMTNADFRMITATTRRVIPLRGDEGARLLLNHNKLLKQYDGAIGGKTGFTKESGRCLVSVAERDGVTLIAVTLRDPDDWKDHATLLDYGFALYESIELCPVDFFDAPLWVVSGTQEYVMVHNDTPMTVSLRRDHGRITCVVELFRFVYAPIYEGQTVGQLRFVEHCPDGTTVTVGETPLLARYGVEKATYRFSVWERIKNLFASH